jgi:hypothetical protein
MLLDFRVTAFAFGYGESRRSFSGGGRRKPNDLLFVASGFSRKIPYPHVHLKVEGTREYVPRAAGRCHYVVIDARTPRMYAMDSIMPGSGSSGLISYSRPTCP